MVPQFVLRELQYIADSTDALKRNRGRRGLDVLARMQKRPDLTILVSDRDFPLVREVDAKLVALARETGARIVTNDYNLNKVAEVSGVTVLNINDLANALKPVVLPGETDAGQRRQGGQGGQPGGRLPRRRHDGRRRQRPALHRQESRSHRHQRDPDHRPAG